MITEQQELARCRVAEQARTAEDRARRREDRLARLEASRRSRRHGGRTVPGPRRELAGLLRRLADRLEPQPTQANRPGLSVVR